MEVSFNTLSSMETTLRTFYMSVFYYTQAVTPSLLAREERQRVKALSSKPTPTAATPATTPSSRKRPLKELPRPTPPVVPEKRMKVLRPVQQRLPSTTSTPETALVRLSSGKIVRVTKEVLEQYQAQVRREQQQQQPQQRPQQPQPVAVVPNGNAARLSRLLRRISPHCQQQQQQQQQQRPNNVGVVSNGRLPVAATAGVAGGGLVKIRANEGNYPRCETESSESSDLGH